MTEYKVRFGFTLTVDVNAKNVEDAVQLAYMGIDPNKVQMDKECLVIDKEGKPVMVELRNE